MYICIWHLSSTEYRKALQLAIPVSNPFEKREGQCAAVRTYASLDFVILEASDVELDPGILVQLIIISRRILFQELYIMISE